MFDVYVKETHPNAQTPQPRTFEERIELYEQYQAEYNMTIPVLIDDMENSWKKVYLPGPTGCVLINIKGVVISESPNIEKDALLMKKNYSSSGL